MKNLHQYRILREMSVSLWRRRDLLEVYCFGPAHFLVAIPCNTQEKELFASMARACKLEDTISLSLEEFKKLPVDALCVVGEILADQFLSQEVRQHFVMPDLADLLRFPAKKRAAWQLLQAWMRA